MISGAAPAPAAIKLSRSTCDRTHVVIYRGAATPSSSHVSAYYCVGRVFVSIDTSTHRFLFSVDGGPAGVSHLMSCDDDGVTSFCVWGDGMLRSFKSLSVV